MALTSIIIPTKDHAVAAAKVVDDIFRTTIDMEVECILVAYPDDTNKLILSSLPDRYNVQLIWDTCRAMDAWNLGASVAKGQYLHASSDDFIYTDGWLYKTIQYIEDSTISDNFFVRIPSNNKCWWAEMGLGHRNFFKGYLGGVIVIPHYQAICVDIEITLRAIHHGVYAMAPNVFVGHQWNNPQRSPTMNQQDNMVLQIRANHGFPNDYQPVIL